MVNVPAALESGIHSDILAQLGLGIPPTTATVIPPGTITVPVSTGFWCYKKRFELLETIQVTPISAAGLLLQPLTNVIGFMLDISSSHHPEVVPYKVLALLS